MRKSVIFTDSFSSVWIKDTPPQTVWFFSNDYLEYQNIQKNLPEGWQLKSVGNKINLVAEEIQDYMINLDKRISNGKFYTSWLASNMADRNPYQSDLFLNLCRGISLVRSAGEEKNNLIYVSDRSLGKALIKICKSSNIDAYWKTSKPKIKSFDFFKSLYAAASGIRYALQHWWHFRKHSITDTHDFDIGIISWVKSEVGRDITAISYDTYFGNLPKWLNNFNFSVSWLLSPMSWNSSLPQISSNIYSKKQKILPIPASIGLMTILRAVAGWIVFRFAIMKKFELAGIDLSPIIGWASEKELRSPHIIQALLYSDIAKKLNQAGIKPKIIIYLYENQPWEKIMLASFRRFLPDTKMIGFLHNPFAKLYLNCYPSKQQWSEGTAPDKLMVMGDYIRDLLLKSGSPVEKIKIGGHLKNPKFARILKTQDSKNLRKNKNILVSCPLNRSEAIELVHKAAVATSTINDVRLLVNFHPVSSKQLILSIKASTENFADYNHIRYVKGAAQKWLKQSDLLLYNSSGTVFDASAEGIPSVYVGPLAGLDLDKLSGETNQKCRTPEDLNTIIVALLTSSSKAANQVATAQKRMHELFSMPNKETWHSIFINLRKKEQS